VATGARKFFLFTHFHFDLSYNEDRVIEINVSSDPMRTVDITTADKLDVQFSYSVRAPARLAADAGPLVLSSLPSSCCLEERTQHPRLPPAGPVLSSFCCAEELGWGQGSRQPTHRSKRFPEPRFRVLTCSARRAGQVEGQHGDVRPPHGPIRALLVPAAAPGGAHAARDTRARRHRARDTQTHGTRTHGTPAWRGGERRADRQLSCSRLAEFGGWLSRVWLRRVPRLPRLQPLATLAAPQPAASSAVSFRHSSAAVTTHLPTRPQIHWFSIINSCVTVLLLTGFLATILLRVLRNDFMKYSRDDEMGEEQEETGWKYLHADVFRFPPHVRGRARG
jgi:hypothetical protein